MRDKSVYATVSKLAILGPVVIEVRLSGSPDPQLVQDACHRRLPTDAPTEAGRQLDRVVGHAISEGKFIRRNLSRRSGG